MMAQHNGLAPTDGGTLVRNLIALCLGDASAIEQSGPLSAVGG